ncbi:hypothetical protein GS539_21145, partial [Rhodococcus hoagii]|nr:hypothetical protein [Prescottella equi]
YLPSLSRIAADGRASLTAIGGTYDTGHESFLGIAAVAAIRGLRVDAAFFSTSSADADGTYHQEESIVAVKAEMLRSARRAGASDGPSKLNGTSLHLVVGLVRDRRRRDRFRCTTGTGRCPPCTGGVDHRRLPRRR